MPCNRYFCWHMNIKAALIIAILLSIGCGYKLQYANSVTYIQKLKADSVLLEKRTQQLLEDNNRLAGQSALIEQALTARLQEKQDSLQAKENQLKERELSLVDLKARKEQEQDAYTLFAKQITDEFTDYDVHTLINKINCKDIAIAINDKKLFMANTTKTTYLANEITKKTIALLNKYPDLEVVILTQADSAWASNKEKITDELAFATTKSNVLLRLIIAENKVLTTRIRAAAQVGGYSGNTQYLFSSDLLPCLHTK